MTRIIAGQFRGHQLRTPPGRATRPTADRVREAMFASIDSMIGGVTSDAWHGLQVLDLFAGSGALGLEALSRGAAHAELVDHSPRAAQTITANITSLKLTTAKLYRQSASAFLATHQGAWDIVFIDPPYDLADESLTKLLEALHPQLADDPLVVVERTRDTNFVWPRPYEPRRDKTYGTTRIWYAR